MLAWGVPRSRGGCPFVFFFDGGSLPSDHYMKGGVSDDVICGFYPILYLSDLLRKSCHKDLRQKEIAATAGTVTADHLGG